MYFLLHKKFQHPLLAASAILGMAFSAHAASSKTAIDPGAEQIIARSVKTYQSLRSYQDEAVLVSNAPAGKEVTHQGISFQAPRFLNVTTISGKQHLLENYDGIQDNSTHMGDSGLYVSKKTLPDDSYGRKVLLQYKPMGEFFTVFLAGINPFSDPFGQQISSLKLGHSSTLGGVKVDAVTATVRDDPKTHITYLIGQADHLVRRITQESVTIMGDKYTSTETHSRIKTNLQFPMDTFTFHAPTGASLENPEDETGDATLIKGQVAPNFRAQNINHKPIALKQYKGKVLLLDFWAVWCPPCRMEMPYFKELYQKYQARGFEIVGVSQDTKLADLKKYLVQEPLPWPQIFDQADKLKIAGDYDLVGLPYSVLIGRDGKILATNQNYLLLDSAIRAALAKKK